MEKGKAKASGSQGKVARATCKREEDKTVNFQGGNKSMSTSQIERGGRQDQLATFQGSPQKHEGRSMFGTDMFEDPFFKDPFFTQPFGEPLNSSGLLRPDGFFSNGIFYIGKNLLDQFHLNNPPMSFLESKGRNVPLECRGGQRNIKIEEIPRHDSGFGSGAGSGACGSNQEPIIEHPNNDNGRGSFHHQQRSPHLNSLRQGPPIQLGSNQGNSYSFYSSSVVCAGSNGPYYASQKTRRQGPNGVIEEEHQEKDSTSGKAHHRVLHGLGEKGHSIIGEQKKDGHEEKFETLHNLGEEVSHFESEWESLAEKNLPKWPKPTSSLPGPNLCSCSRTALPPGGSSHTN
ncbi:unnamed protein product [Calypogeia fissa]